MFFHWTRRSQTEQIMDEGLLPEPPRRQYTTKNSLSPTFGGIYYCRKPQHFAAILNNMAQVGHSVWLYDEPSLIIFKGKMETFPDEDDLFAPVSEDGEKIKWSGPGALAEEGRALAAKLEKFKMNNCPEKDFLSIQRDVREMMRQSAPHMSGQMNNVRGNIWEAVSGKDLTVLHFRTYIKNEKARFAYEGNLEDLPPHLSRIARQAVQALDEAGLEPQIVNSLYPYDGLKNHDLPEDLRREEEEDAGIAPS